MRKLLTFGIFVSLAVIAAIIFYIFFPHIWGEALFPNPYQQEIKNALAREAPRGCDVDESFIAALMFAESGMRQDARSGAGAEGLMQMLPSTAAAMASELGLANFKRQDIFTAQTAVDLGIHYVCNIYLENSKALAATVAWYNFGPRARNTPRESLPRETQRLEDKILRPGGLYDLYSQLYPTSQKRPSDFKVVKQESFLSVIAPKNLFKILIGE